MLLIQTAKLTVKTQYYVNNNGTDYYQRRVPLPLRKFFKGQTHFRIKLSGKHSSMVAEIAHLAGEHDKLFRDLRGKSGVDLAEAEAQAILAYYGVRPGDGNVTMPECLPFDDQPHLADINHYLMVKETHGTLTSADMLAKRLLTKPMPVMLNQCLDIYFANHPKGMSPKFIASNTKHWKHIVEVLGSVAVETITREMARGYVDNRVRKVSTNTVAREINTIKAVLNVVIREKSLTFTNPFIMKVIDDIRVRAVA